ncbi:MAG: hypothetical protein MUF18_04905 [Fimbriiglobus sp.]|nr:hypothetical protein [Fimbriiglobus sp.]
MRSLLVLFTCSAPLFAQVPQPVPPAKFDIMDWTPRPAVGKGEPWERMTDPQWDDARFLKMDTGPAFNATFGLTTDVIVNNRVVKQLNHIAYKGTAVKLTDGKNVGCVIFDRATCRIVAAWTGGFLQHSARRFALLNTPTMPAGAKLVFNTAPAAGWADVDGKFPAVTKPTAPLTHLKYRGHYLNGDRVVFRYTANSVGVLDSVKLETINGNTVLARTVWIDATDNPLTLNASDGRQVKFAAAKEPQTSAFVFGGDAKVTADDLPALIKPGKPHWGKPIETKLVKGDESGPFAVDTLTIPYENPFNALFYCTGLDFLPDGRVAVCTCHGDVWLAKVSGETVLWQRFATGLYHPLGLKVVDKKIVVLERGQLTRLHDNNDDGEADFYECVCNDWHTGAGEHSYDTCLETDPDGNFYFFKTGDTDLPSGGTLLKVSKDGKTVETFATGVRHPIGLGISPTGIVTGADQEGNWMPATRIDQYTKGGFYGDMRAHHRKVAPTTYDPPLCWLPREVDNSAGGQVWVPKGAFGPLGGLPLHFSYGRCRAYVLLRQEVEKGVVQGGVAPLPLSFLSGSCRGRFDADNHLWVCGLNGWQTAAKADGSLQRVRYTGQPLDTVVKHQVTDKGVRLTFSRPLDKATATNPANYKAAAWNYRWSADYGSKRWRPSAPTVEGQDEFAFTSATLENETTVFLKSAAPMTPVMQLQVGYNLKAKADAKAVTGSVFLTVTKPSKE